MPKLHIELSDTLHAQLVDRAKENKRFLKDEVIDILEHGMETVLIPIVGKVDKKGNIILDSYWKKPDEYQKIKCTAERRWEQELPRWEGVIIKPDGEKISTGLLRVNKDDAILDAERLAEELENGVTGR